MRVCVVGLGRIGLPTAIVCLRAGHDVVGVDRDPTLLEQIRSASLPYEEPGLEPEELAALELQSHMDAVSAEVFLICVGTTSEGRLDPSPVLEVAANIPAQARDYLVVAESTIPPGTCAKMGTMGHDLVAHCPERARPGEVFDDIGRIPRLIGGVDAASTERASSFYRTLTDARLIECNADEAALAKLAENAEREVRIAFANELADVAWEYRLDGGRVAELANSHPRVRILRAGVGVGGDCLPMATEFFAEHADGVAASARALHGRRPSEIAARIAAQLEPGSTICVLGRTYRENVRHDEGLAGFTPADELLAELGALGLRVSSWDPSHPEGSLREAIARVDAYFVAVPHEEFADLAQEKQVRAF